MPAAAANGGSGGFAVSELPDAPTLLVDRAGLIMRASPEAAILAGADQPDKLVGKRLNDILLGTGPDLRLTLGECPGVPVRAVRWRVPGTGLDAVLLTDVSDVVAAADEVATVRRRFAETQRLAKMGWWEFDHVSHETIWSPSLHALLGVEPGSVEPCLRTMLTFVHPDDVERAKEHWRRHQVAGEAMDIELRIVRPDGETRWVHAVAAARPVSDRASLPVTGYARDVTDRHTTYDTLAEDRALLLDAQRIARMGSFTVDLRTDQIHRSEALDEMYAAVNETPVDDRVGSMVAVDPRQHPMLLAVRDRLAQGIPHEPLEFEIDGVADNRVYVVRLRGRDDGTGNVGMVQGTIQDVTQNRLLERQLLADRRRFEDAQRAARMGTWEWNSTTHETTWSPMMYELFGISRDTPVTHQTFLNLLHPEDKPWFQELKVRAVREHKPMDCEYRIIRPDGVLRMFHCYSAPAPGAEDSGLRLGTAQDITEQRVAETRMLRSSQRFSDLVAVTPVGIGLFDETERLVDANDALCDLLGFSLERLRGRPSADLIHPDDRANFELVSEQIRASEHRGTHRIPQQVFVRADGEPVYCELHVAMSVQDDGRRFWLVVFQDITERRRTAEALRHQATHDELTGLPNRFAVKELLGELLGGPDSARIAVLFCDIDNFKRVNDSLGHDAGDELLVALARRLEGGLPTGCTVARLSGDEYVIICADIDAVGGVDTLANRVSTLLRTAVPVHGQLVRVTATIGAAMPNGGPNTGADLLRFADAAMFEAKKRGAGRVALANAALIASADRQVHLEGQLREALATDGLVLHYQPVVGPDGTMQTAEALVRWPHPDRGLLAPDVFLPVAEQGGLMRELDRWVLRGALREAANWPAHCGKPVAVAVNLAGLVPGDPEFVDIVANAVLEAGIEWDRVVLELVETSLIDLPSRTRTAMAELVDRGVRFAVDDFGTGYSSLARLKELPAQIIKVDRRFVAGVGSDSSDFAVASAVVDMSRAMGRSCVAEGVETATQFHVLRGMGVDAYQGWLFSRAVPVRDFHTLLAGGALAVPTTNS
ncbi:MAG TPA: EAL domain-containing protein [Pseudonocardiaceae bacterium]|jgi:diguanylate cyclase (GGDEF)-like protein/PAS domain S-box-containing protein|nr:EAL domain-containing protein [Pseudonocardiaceae bacterium]